MTEGITLFARRRIAAACAQAATRHLERRLGAGHAQGIAVRNRRTDVAEPGHQIAQAFPGLGPGTLGDGTVEEGLGLAGQPGMATQAGERQQQRGRVGVAGEPGFRTRQTLVARMGWQRAEGGGDALVPARLEGLGKGLGGLRFDMQGRGTSCQGHEHVGLCTQGRRQTLPSDQQGAGLGRVAERRLGETTFKPAQGGPIEHPLAAQAGNRRQGLVGTTEPGQGLGTQAHTRRRQGGARGHGIEAGQSLDGAVLLKPGGTLLEGRGQGVGLGEGDAVLTHPVGEACSACRRHRMQQGRDTIDAAMPGRQGEQVFGALGTPLLQGHQAVAETLAGQPARVTAHGMEGQPGEHHQQQHGEGGEAPEECCHFGSQGDDLVGPVQHQQAFLRAQHLPAHAPEQGEQQAAQQTGQGPHGPPSLRRSARNCTRVLPNTGMTRASRVPARVSNCPSASSSAGPGA